MFDYTNVLTLLGGICLFLFGMTVMGDALEKSAGSQLKGLLAKMTSNPLKGFILGAGVTAIIQSSSATTVMLVGFVNSGLMSLSSVIPVIMGANVGTTITAWILSLMGMGDDNFLMTMLKPTSFTPILAVIGVILYIFLKNAKKKDIGLILLGFAVLIYGMDIMSDAVSPLKDSDAFKNILLMFDNPILGVLAGALITAIIQSSSASVGILQALSITGAVTFGSAIPIIMGQNIGTCVTALISSIGANKNARRVAMVHLYFNIVGTVVLLTAFYTVNAVVGGFGFLTSAIDETYIAIVHSAFNIGCTALLLPCHKLLEKLAILTVKDKNGTEEKVKLFDDMLLTTPSIALDQCRNVTFDMAKTSVASLKKAFSLFDKYDSRLFDEIEKEENEVDIYEDEIGSYLVKLTKCDLTERDSLEVTKLLHIIGDLERISDHAVNIAESAREIQDKKITFSTPAQGELKIMINAVIEILDASLGSFTENSLELAAKVEPLEEVVDNLKDRIKLNHVKRVQNNECTIELGFILSDLLTNLERISDHCSNIAGCVIEIAHSSLGMHGYTKALRRGNEVYDQYYKEFSRKYSLQGE